MELHELMKLTAENARKIQQEHPNKTLQLKNILTEINRHIQDASESSEHIFWYERMEDVTKSKLSELGYYVENLTERHEILYKISWGI